VLIHGSRLSFWNTCDAFELYGHVPTPNRALTACVLIDNQTVVFAQNWESGKHTHLDGKDLAVHFRFYFERVKADSVCLKRRGQPRYHCGDGVRDRCVTGTYRRATQRYYTTTRPGNIRRAPDEKSFIAGSS
jgi:hypothetical protein